MIEGPVDGDESSADDTEQLGDASPGGDISTVAPEVALGDCVDPVADSDSGDRERAIPERLRAGFARARTRTPRVSADGKSTEVSTGAGYSYGQIALSGPHRDAVVIVIPKTAIPFVIGAIAGAILGIVLSALRERNAA